MSELALNASRPSRLAAGILRLPRCAAAGTDPGGKTKLPLCSEPAADVREPDPDGTEYRTVKKTTTTKLTGGSLETNSCSTSPWKRRSETGPIWILFGGGDRLEDEATPPGCWCSCRSTSVQKVAFTSCWSRSLLLCTISSSEGSGMFPRGVCLSSCPPGPLLSGSDPSGHGGRDSNLLSSGGHLSRRLHPLLDSYHQDACSLNKAKRARVENAIRGMICTDAAAAADQEAYQEELQHAAVHHRPENTGEEQETGQHLHLRRSFSHTLSDCGREEKPPLCSLSAAPPAGDEGLLSRRWRGWRKVEPRSSFQSGSERLQLMADVFKAELSRAVSRSVDAIFRSMPLLPASEEDADAAPQAEKWSSSSCCGAADVHVPDVQTEALSLVVQRPHLERSAAPRHPRPPSLLCHAAAEGEEQRPGRSSSAFSGLQDAEPRHEARWRPKVNSRCVRSPHQAAAADPLLLESRCPSGVKMESDGVLRSHLYATNEGLTATHLKKAKLMFFYTRYPSSLVLRSCFHDVQFSRCIASQLIKWFSNFREFYYIQMEKSARAALLDLRDLTVGRESELFRALNMHYNKANDFQVPDCFLEVAEVTLREFYAAISLGKDRDPSWKKAIYKVICKLDSEVPAEFRGHLGV